MPGPVERQRAGDRPHRITIERPPRVLDDYGLPDGQWVTVRRLWASVRALTAREKWIAEQANATTTHRIDCPYVAGVDATMRADWSGRKLYFESADDPDGSRRNLQILAHERKGN